MKHLTILAPEGENNISSIAGAYKLFTRANAFYRDNGKPELFRIQVAGLSDKINYHQGLFSVQPHTHINAIRRTDLIIIPSLNHQFDQAILKNGPMLKWIQQQHRKGAEIASLCTGTFLLAATGLLNGKSCSTHWLAANRFRELFPEVDIQPDKIITDENGIYTNGGAYSFLNLLLHLIEKYYDRRTAVFLSKVYQIDMDRDSQSVFTIFAGQKTHDDDVVHKAQTLIEKSVSDKLSVDQLCTRFAVSRRSFDRRFYKATGNTPLEYAQRVKMESAKRKLESSRKTVNEVMYEVGYSDAKAFREVFRKITGLSPLAYRNRFIK